MSEGVPIQHPMVTRAIERAQKQVEGQNFSIRKHLLEYDDVMNKQRETIYSQRREILEGKDLREYYLNLIDSLVEWYLDQHANKTKHPDDWDWEALRQAVFSQFGLDLNQLNLDREAITYETLFERLTSALKGLYEQKEKALGPDRMREFERLILLQVIDARWKDHLLEMDYLKEGIGLRGYGQRDPLIEYKKESYEMFQQLLDRIEEDAVRYLFLIQPVVEGEQQPRQAQRERPLYYQRPQAGASAGAVIRQARPLIPGKKKKH